MIDSIEFCCEFMSLLLEVCSGDVCDVVGREHLCVLCFEFIQGRLLWKSCRMIALA